MTRQIATTSKPVALPSTITSKMPSPTAAKETGPAVTNETVPPLDNDDDDSSTKERQPHITSNQIRVEDIMMESTQPSAGDPLIGN